MNIVIFFIIFFTFSKYGTNASDSVANINFQFGGNFGQNLTECIENALKDNNTNHRTVLKEALKWSPLVYYETDTLLNNIEVIIPVIDLLNQLKPDGVPNIKIILSLNYLNKTNGEFIWSRMADVYYSLNLKITQEIKIKILNSVAGIVINFTPPLEWRVYQISYWKYPYTTKFTSYIKNFVSLYFGKKLIPVGLVYNNNFPNVFSPQVYYPSDFIISHKDIKDFTWNFPIFTETFMPKYFWGTNRNRSTLLQVSVNVSNAYKWSDGLSSTTYRNFYVKSISQATKQNQNVTRNFTTELYKRAGLLFNHITITWAFTHNKNVILGDVTQNITSEFFSRNSFSRKTLLLPYIQIKEVDEDSCVVKAKFSKLNEHFEAVILSEQTWRTLSRFQDDLEDDSLICNRTDLQNTQTNSLKVFMNFTVDTLNNLAYLAEFMKDMITEKPSIAQMYLDTIIFEDEYLKAPADIQTFGNLGLSAGIQTSGGAQTFSQIQEFVNFTKAKYKIGCSVKFSSVVTAMRNGFYYKRTGSFGNNSRNVLGIELCQPILHSLDIMVWIVTSQGSINTLFSYYSDLFLTREIILSYFPNITVLVQFEPSLTLDKRIMADLYNVPIVVPSAEIFQ